MPARTSKFHAIDLRRLCAGLVACGLAFGAQAGQVADANRTTASVVVGYSDLDLTDAQGAKTLYTRLRAAAREVCGSTPDPRELRQYANYQACYTRALHKAVHRIDSQRLHALHAERSRHHTVG
jgi:UrcA family protein